MRKGLSKKSLKVLSGIAAAAVFEAAMTAVPAAFNGAGSSEFFAFGAAGETTEETVTSNVEAIKQLPAWCWAVSAQMMIRQYVFLGRGDFSNKYIHTEFGQACVDAANEIYGEGKKSLEDFERLYNEKVKNVAGGNGADSALNKEQAFLVYLSTDYLSTARSFISGFMQEQKRIVDIVLKATGLDKDFVAIQVNWGTLAERRKAQASGSDLGFVVSQALFASKIEGAIAMPIVTNRGGHYRVIAGYKKIGESYKALIQETGGGKVFECDMENRGCFSDYEILFIAKKGEVGIFDFGQDKNLKETFLLRGLDKSESEKYVIPIIEKISEKSSYYIDNGAEKVVLTEASKIEDTGEKVDQYNIIVSDLAPGYTVSYYEASGKSLEDLRNNYSLKRR